MRDLSLVFGALLSQANKFKLFPLAAAFGLLVVLTPTPTHAETCAPTPSGMVAWWPLDEQQGITTVVDITGGHNGVPKPSGAIGSPGGPSSVLGQVGTALQTASSQDTVGYVEVPSSADFDFGTNDFSIDAWVMFPSGVGAEAIVSKFDSTTNTGYSLSTTSQSGALTLALQIGAQVYYGPPIPANLPVGTWIFVAATRKGGGPTAVVTLYVNGASIGAKRPTVTASSPGTPLLIGEWSGNITPFHVDLAIDELEIFNRALAQTELQSIVTAGKAGKCRIPPKKGMTWIQGKSDATTGTITVGCSGCDASHGDTVCTELRPLLCIYKPTPPFQLPKGLSDSEYNRWSGGVVATTQPVAGNTFGHISAEPDKDANSYCKDKFGPGWRVAEFHDGQYWNFQAYGGTVTPPTIPPRRYWVHIDDQKDGNCWATP